MSALFKGVNLLKDNLAPTLIDEKLVHIAPDFHCKEIDILEILDSDNDEGEGTGVTEEGLGRLECWFLRLTIGDCLCLLIST